MPDQPDQKELDAFAESEKTHTDPSLLADLSGRLIENTATDAQRRLEHDQFLDGVLHDSFELMRSGVEPGLEEEGEVDG